MGPAALLDYDRKRLRGLMLEEGGPTSHVAIVARALGIAAVGEIENATGLVEAGDPIIVDGVTGDVYLRPPPDIEAAYVERVRLRARRQAQYRALRDKPCVTKDGDEIALMINAGLLVDLPHIEETGAAGIGLFRTELQFMVAPRCRAPASSSRSIARCSTPPASKPVTFRTLDIGGDKVLPYMRNVEEENPALGWRAIRLGLDRPGLMRSQIRALLRAAGGRALKIMFPMIAVVEEFDQAKAHGRARAHASAPARPHAAGAGRDRRDGRGALAAVPARRAACRGSISCRSARTICCSSCSRPTAAMRGSPTASIRCRRRCCARLRTDRRQGPQARQAGDAVRRTGLEADRRAGAGRASAIARCR